MSFDKGTPLHVAVRNGDIAKVERLLAADADVNAVDKYGWTPLHGAAYDGNAAAVAVLLAAGGDVNAVEKQGNTPLHRAALNGNPASVSALLAAGANPNAVNESGDTPFHLAALSRSEQAVSLLIAAGAVLQPITLDDVMAMEPCGFYPRESVEALFAGRESLTVADVWALDIPDEDRRWVVAIMKPMEETQ